MRIHKAVVLLIALAPVMAVAQQFLPSPSGDPVDPNTRFEVVAIRPADNGSGMMLRMTPGGFEATGVPMGVLLRQALQKPDYEIVGAPGWINSDRYSIRAKPPEGLPLSALTVMLVNLLKDRFQLATHLETRELPIFHLVIARADARLGPELKATPAECQATIAERLAAAKAAAAGRAGGPLPPLPSLPGPNDPLPCGFARITPGIAAGSGRTIAQIVPTIADLVGRPVIDKTGLTGLYDFSIKYAPDGRYAGAFGPPPGAPTPPVDPDAPGFTTALQEQLGLKLESTRGPVEVLVIDKFEKPTLD
ncbi:MAG: TIGR03435 family protein [Vicinamibacterales bacterium]